MDNTNFDPRRAVLSDKDSFQPFHVQVTRSLQEALASSKLREDTPVLMLKRDAGVLVLLTQQMAYHHVAQGKIAGEPWLVSF